jgi:threonine dehydratase
MNIEMIRAAATRIDGHVLRTPLLSSDALNALAGRRVLVKPECLQMTGSFKARGSWAAISALTETQRKAGVIAYSSGNHAQGMARAAAAMGAPCVIVMPSDAPAVKVANTRSMGAEVVLYDRATEDRDAIGTRLSVERNLTLIRPFDEPLVIAGQGTVGLEIAADANALGIGDADVLVCCGGGGLTSGIALALAADAPGLRVRPVEPQGFDDVTRSLAAGEIQQNPAMTGSICDAVITRQPGEVTFPIMQRLCGPGIVVTDDDCLRAMCAAFAHLHIVIEPGGAVALAGALYHPDTIAGDTVIVVATGGNVDPAMFTRALDTVP